MTSNADNSSDLRDGIEKHVWPAGDGHGVVTKVSSDAVFGADGLGLANTVWMKILSFLARTGIQEQTGSNKGETDIDSCVKGWGQGAYSSRVFHATKGIDQEQLKSFIEHLQNIAKELKIPNVRITEKVLGSFIATQIEEPYSTINGVKEVKTRREKLGGVFRGHVQWQGFITLCGHVDNDGVVHVTPELIRTFFNCPGPFFDTVIAHRRKLKDGSLELGGISELLSDVPGHIDHLATDRRYRKNKSGLLIILRIAKYMLFPPRAKTGPLVRPIS